MRHALPILLAASVAATPAASAGVSRTYSYFSVEGTTLEEIEQQLRTRGPHVESSGQRHPGATRMEFTTRLGYGESTGQCRIVEAQVALKADVILPRWRDRAGAEESMVLIWDTLARDIERHEESHLVIARNHAREIEDALKALPPMRSCADLADRAEETRERVLARHDAAQERFDRIEGANFEDRFLRLLRYRLGGNETRPRGKPGFGR